MLIYLGCLLFQECEKFKISKCLEKSKGLIVEKKYKNLDKSVII